MLELLREEERFDQMYDGIAKPDPFEEPYWNLIQTLAWVYLGDRALVRQGADGAERGSFWQQLTLPDGSKEWVETQANPPGPLTLTIIAAVKNGAAYDRFKDAEAAFLAALRAGHIGAMGLKNNLGDPEEIAPNHWTYLKFEYHDRREQHCAGPIETFRSGATRWYRLQFKREDVFRLWPDPFRVPGSDEHVPLTPIGGYDLLPEGTVSFSEAGGALYRRLYPDNANALIRFEREVWDANGQRSLPCNDLASVFQGESSALRRSVQEAIAEALTRGELVAKLERPDGQIRVVPSSYWQTGAARSWTMVTGRLEPAGLAFESVDRYRHSPCFLDREKFEMWLSAQYGLQEIASNGVERISKTAMQKRVGRPRGSGSFELLDKPLIEKMHKLRSANPSLSVTGAAYQAVGEAAGGGTPESKAKRLSTRYKKTFSENQQ